MPQAKLHASEPSTGVDVHLTPMPNLTPTGIHHYLTGGMKGVTGSREGIWSKLGSGGLPL